MITNSGFVTWRREKISYWCMLFLLCSLFYLFKSYFTLSFFFLISFSIHCVSCLSRCPSSSYGYCSYLYWIKPTWFLLITLFAHRPFLLTANTPKKCPLPFWLFGLHYIWACSVFSLSSITHPMKNSYPFLSTIYLSLSFDGKNLWSFFTYLSIMHQVAPTGLLPILGQDVFPAEHFLKEVLAGYQRDHFLPSTKPHPL